MTPGSALPPGVIDVTPGRAAPTVVFSGRDVTPIGQPPDARYETPGRVRSAGGCGCGRGCGSGPGGPPAGATPVEDPAPQRPHLPSRSPFLGDNLLAQEEQQHLTPRLPCRFSCGGNERCVVGHVCCRLQAFALGGRSPQVVCASNCQDACRQHCTWCRAGLPCEVDSVCSEACRLANLSPLRPQIYCDDLGGFARLDRPLRRP